MQLFKNFNSKIFPKYFFVIAFIFAIFIPSKSFAAWSYSVGVLTSTGATEASPDSLLAGIAIVQAADATRGYVNNKFGKITNVRIDISNSSWIKYDDDSTIEFAGTTFQNFANETSNGANNGGSLIMGYRSVLIKNTTTVQYWNPSNPCGIGGNFIALRSASGINPLVIQQSTVRTDFPSFDPYSVTPNRVDIGGLTIRFSGSSHKIYFGLARNLVKAENVNFEKIGSLGETQSASTNYQSFAFPVAQHDGDTFINTSNFYNTKWGTQQTGTISFGLATVRQGNYFNYDPIFPTATWNGTYAGSNFGSDNRYAKASYSHNPTFKTGATAISGVNTKWIGERYFGTYNYTLSSLSESLDKSATSDANGKVSTYLLSALRGRESGVLQTSNKYRWTFKARKYNYKTSTENVWSAKTFLPDGQNGPLTEEIQMLEVNNLTLTEAQALALTGISFATTSATVGTVTISSARTVAELWQYYRAWISQTANFGSNDTWTYDGTTLNIGAWNIIIASGGNLTSGKINTTGAVTVQSGGNNSTTYFDQNGDSVVNFTGVATTSLIQIFSSSGSVLASSTNILNYRYIASSSDFITVKMTRLDNAVLSQKYYLIGGENELPMSLGATEFTNSDRILLQSIYTILNQIYSKVIVLPARVASYFDIIQLLE
jgi:hypothetical protein